MVSEAIKNPVNLFLLIVALALGLVLLYLILTSGIPRQACYPIADQIDPGIVQWLGIRPIRWGCNTVLGIFG